MSKAIITIEDGDEDDVKINVEFTPAVEGYNTRVQYFSHRLALTALNHVMSLTSTHPPRKVRRIKK
ncbi:hypothetical protein AGMMS50256_38960 [Betaproteobacteria bacterium]|nr:hypothetical protein AGMMS50256_38960 [Betaproteobacteria bacterium]